MVSRSSWRSKFGAAALAALAILVFAGCQGPPSSAPASRPVAITSPRPPAPPVTRRPTAAVNGPDEIIVAGRRFHTGTRIVTWQEPGGYDATVGMAALPPRIGLERAARDDLAALQGRVDQFVLHYDGAGLSRLCFNVLQERKLNVHFLLDVDGTVYQTLDLRERAVHATIANDRSIGIEIANIGAYERRDAGLLAEWYDAAGRLRVPPEVRDDGLRTPNFQGRSARARPVAGKIQDQSLTQYDYTPQQYAALIKLTAALCRVFPRLRCDYPSDARGRLITHQLPARDLARFRGVLGHFHVQANKVDPGPALQWSTIITGARRELAAGKKPGR